LASQILHYSALSFAGANFDRTVYFEEFGRPHLAPPSAIILTVSRPWATSSIAKGKVLTVACSTPTKWARWCSVSLSSLFADAENSEYKL